MSLDQRDSPTPVGAGLTARLRTLRPRLGGAAARVADQILADPAAVAAMTISRLALAAGTSPTTVTRLCRRLGLDGYPELRIGLAAESGREVGAWRADLGADIRMDDPMRHILSTIGARDAEAIRDTVEQLNVTDLERACELLAHARRIDIYGSGGSAIVAAELQGRLDRIDRPSWVRGDPHTALTSAVLLGPQDVAFAISHSGETVETYEPLMAAAERGCATIALTNDPDSMVARIADVTLTTAVRPVSLRPDTLAVRHSQLVVLDGLYVGVAQRTYDRAVIALQTTAQVIEEHRSAQAPGRRRQGGKYAEWTANDTEGQTDESSTRTPDTGGSWQPPSAGGDRTG